ncbi:MAG: S8 family serine peptidase [Candidatus Sericytochromatia bacterium]
MKKSMYVLFCLCVTGCVSNINTLTPPRVNNTLNTGAFNIKSTTQPNEIKKSFLASQRFIRNTAKPIIETKTFNVSANDLKRTFILNIYNGTQGYERVSSATIKVNGQVYAGQNDFNQNVSDLSIKLSNLKEGVNILEVQINSKPNSSIDISIDGFVKPIDIPRAIHSLIQDTKELRQNGLYEKGLVGIKFLEGMKVRLIDNPDGSQKLVDLNGTSLTLFNNLIKQLGIKLIYRPTGLPYEELEQDEVKTEALFKTDAPNQTLFYYLQFDENIDVWSTVDKLREIPYLEESFPEFLPEGQDAEDPSLTEEHLKGALDFGNTFDNLNIKPCNNIPHTDDGGRSYECSGYSTQDWLKNTSVLKNKKNDGAWSITNGNSYVKIAVLDSGFQLSGTAPLSDHEDLGGSNFEPKFAMDIFNQPDYVKEFLKYQDEDIPKSIKHGTSVAGIVGAKKNGLGIAGVAYKSTIMPILAFSPANSKIQLKPLCIYGGEKCNSTVDSILIARKNGAKVLNLSYYSSGLTIEHTNPIVRGAIAAAVADDRNVVIIAGNTHDNNIAKITRNYSGFPVAFPNPDTGSVIVGGLDVEGKGLYTGYNYGISIPYDTGFYLGTHGTDVSAPSEFIWAPTYDSLRPELTNLYHEFGGTSGAAPIVSGTIALMLSVKPDLTPLEIRDTLRNTQEPITNSKNIVDINKIDPNDGTKKPIAGMINAYKAVSKYSNSLENNSRDGLFAKFYANTIYLPPENILNTQFNLSQEHISFKSKVINNFNTLSNTSDIFNIGLNNYYVADIQGLIQIDEAGLYYFEMANDDGAILQIDSTNLIDSNSPNSFTPDNPRRNNIYLSQGLHTIRLMYSQITGNAGLSVKWQKPNDLNSQIIPDSVLFHSSISENVTSYVKRSGIVGRFFDSTKNPPEPPLYPFTNKIFDRIDFVNPNLNYGDTFEIGRSDNFTAFFSGYLRLPDSFPEGNYRLVVGHDDGATLSFDGQELIRKIGAFDYTLSQANRDVLLKRGEDHQIIINYQEQLYESELGLFWIKPGTTKPELIPSEALFH